MLLGLFVLVFHDKLEVVEAIMTEREKMLAGKLYDCGDSELLAQWQPTLRKQMKRKEF